MFGLIKNLCAHEQSKKRKKERKKEREREREATNISLDKGQQAMGTNDCYKATSNQKAFLSEKEICGRKVSKSERERDGVCVRERECENTLPFF